MNDKNDKKKNRGSSGLVIGMCLGIAIGTALGAATHNYELWTPVGISVGLCLGLVLGHSGEDEDGDDPDKKQ